MCEMKKESVKDVMMMNGREEEMSDPFWNKKGHIRM